MFVSRSSSSDFGIHVFFFNATATTEIYTLSLHDALPIWPMRAAAASAWRRPSSERWRPGARPGSLTPVVGVSPWRTSSTTDAASGIRRGLRDGPPLGADEVDEHVLAEAIGGREEGAAPVDPGHLLDERGESVALLQHEGVDGDAVAGAALDFLERLLQRPPGGRVGELGLGALHVGGGLPVGDHDHLLVAALVAGQELSRELEAGVHVGAHAPLPGGQVRKLGRGELPGVEREAHDVEAVARELT